MLILASVALLLAAAWLVVSYVANHAVDGHEDASGFHYTGRIEVRGAAIHSQAVAQSSAKQSASEVVASRNG